jgi:hypothetical protein
MSLICVNCRRNICHTNSQYLLHLHVGTRTVFGGTNILDEKGWFGNGAPLYSKRKSGIPVSLHKRDDDDKLSDMLLTCVFLEQTHIHTNVRLSDFAPCSVFTFPHDSDETTS